METKLLSLGLIFASVAALAQTPRLSLYEEFTGETCPPCASTNPGLNAKLSSPTNTPLVVAIKWQVPIPSAPSNTWSLYRTNKAEIDWRYRSSVSGYGYPSQNNAAAAITSGINSAPSGRFDGQHQWKFGATSDHPTFVSNAIIATAQSYTSAFNVVMAKKWDANMNVLTVTVNIVATAPFTATGPLVFRAVMIEKIIQFSVQPGTNGETKFEDPVIASFPSIQAGTSMAGNWVVGQSQKFVLTCPIPSYTRNKNQVDMVGFIQDDGNKKVAQAARASGCDFINLTVTTANTLVCEGNQVTITAGGSNTYSWSTGQTGNSIVFTPTGDTTVFVNTDDLGNCLTPAYVSLKLLSCTGINLSSKNKFNTEIYPNPNKGEFLIKVGFANEKTRLIIFNTLGQKVYEQDISSDETTIKTNLSKGLYNFEVLQASQKMSVGKLVVE